MLKMAHSSFSKGSFDKKGLAPRPPLDLTLLNNVDRDLKKYKTGVSLFDAATNKGTTVLCYFSETNFFIHRI